jgi:hypothetical protein
MRQNKRYLASLVAFLGVVFLAGACSGGVDATRQSESNVAKTETQNGEPIKIAVELELKPNLVKHPSGHVVIPGKPRVKRNQRIQWKNETRGKIVIEIPDERIFGVSFMKELRAGETWESPRVDDKAPNGEYEYSIYLYENHKFADANSSPGIIIP